LTCVHNAESEAAQNSRTLAANVMTTVSKED